MTLGERIKARRKELRWTLRELEKRTGLSNPFLSQVETGKTLPGAKALSRLSEALEMSIDRIVNGTEWVKHSSVIAVQDPIVFLDIDGVLNAHDWDERAASNRIRFRCVEQLSRILEATGARIVVSSAWRYMIGKGAMTTRGFEYMLRTHGAHSVVGRILGTTPLDEEIEGRGLQIRHWLNEHGGCRRYVVIDDDDFDFADWGHPHVKTDGAVGLTAADADRAIAILVEQRSCSSVSSAP